MVNKTTKKGNRRAPRKVNSRSKQPAVVHREVPSWQRFLISLAIVSLLSGGFYWFFVRPYAYRWKPCYGYQEYGVCLPSNYDVHGLDVSHYQDEVDWEKLAHQHNPLFPLQFVFMKATEGGDLADDCFERNFEQARRYGFVRGAYHYFNPRTDALRQADFFIHRVKLESGDLPPVLDVESVGSLSDEELKQRVQQWLQRVEKHYGITPILYTGYKFRMRHLNDTVFNRYPYWIAHYYVDSVRYQGNWQFWQHTDVGRVPGIGKRVDLDVFNGTYEQLKALTIP